MNDNPPTSPDPRVYFAAERTMLAWIRTGIALMGFGFVVARFGLFLRELAAARAGVPETHQPRLSLWVGTTLVLIGVAVTLASAINHLRFRKKFIRGEPFVTPKGLLVIVLSVLLAAVGIAMTFYLLIIGNSGR
jgi:putative membrane protein